MDRGEILSLVQGVVRTEIGDLSIVLTPETLATDVAGWDSLAHVRIMVAIEAHFQIRFEVDELNSIENVGSLVDGIVAKL